MISSLVHHDATAAAGAAAGGVSGGGGGGHTVDVPLSQPFSDGRRSVASPPRTASATSPTGTSSPLVSPGRAGGSAGGASTPRSLQQRQAQATLHHHHQQQQQQQQQHMYAPSSNTSIAAAAAAAGAPPPPLTASGQPWRRPGSGGSFPFSSPPTAASSMPPLFSLPAPGSASTGYHSPRLEFLSGGGGGAGALPNLASLGMALGGGSPRSLEHGSLISRHVPRSYSPREVLSSSPTPSSNPRSPPRWSGVDTQQRPPISEAPTDDTDGQQQAPPLADERIRRSRRQYLNQLDEMMLMLQWEYAQLMRVREMLATEQQLQHQQISEADLMNDTSMLLFELQELWAKKEDTSRNLIELCCGRPIVPTQQQDASASSSATATATATPVEPRSLLSLATKLKAVLFSTILSPIVLTVTAVPTRYARLRHASHRV